MAERARANDSLDQLHVELEAANMAPTWVYVGNLVPAKSPANYRPWIWRWNDVIPLLLRAGDLIRPDSGGERRSMEHVNPDLKQSFSACRTIATAFQLVHAGERAPAHRHTAAALRFVAQSKGGEVYTKVQGESFRMEQNDLILTPAWTWHEHANDSAHDIVWLDALDFPLVNLLQASSFHPGNNFLPNRKDHMANTNAALYRPAGWSPYVDPIMGVRYPWAEMHTALERLRTDAGSPFDGVLLEYLNPATSGPTLPTMSCRAQLLRPSERTRAHRATSSTVYFVIGGEGYSVIGGTRFEWGRGDVFVVPNWDWHEHASGVGDCLLFSITDQPAMTALGFYREEPYPDNDGHQAVAKVFAS